MMVTSADVAIRLRAENDKLKAENARLREALEDIDAGRGDALVEEGDKTTAGALMRRAERALSAKETKA